MTKKRPYFTCFADQLKDIFKIIIFISLIISFLVFIYIICVELIRKTVIIDAFEVPSELQQKGYTSQVLVSKLNDQIIKIKEIASPTVVQEDITSFTYFEKTKGANLNAPEFPTIEKQKEFNIKIKGVDFPLSFLLQYVKEHFVQSTIHVACEVTLIGNRNQLKLTTRVLGMPAKNYCGSLTNLDSILHKAAKHIYEYTDPYTFAFYLYFNNQLEDCVNIIQCRLLQEKKKDAHLAYNLWGLVLRRQKNYDEAIEKFNKARKIKPWYAPTFNNLGIVLRDQGKYKESIKNYQEANEIDPYSASTYNNWGLALHGQGKYDEAIEKYRDAINIDSRSIPTYINWGLALHDQGKDTEAIRKYQDAIDIDLLLAPAYNNLGVSLYSQKKYDEAIKNYEKL